MSHACYLLEDTPEPRELQQRWAEQSEETEGCKDLRRCENIPIIHQHKHTNTRETDLHRKLRAWEIWVKEDIKLICLVTDHVHSDESVE